MKVLPSVNRIREIAASKRPPKWVQNLGKVALVATIGVLLYYSIRQKADLGEEFYGSLQNVWQLKNWIYLVIILLLLALNLAFETLKWQLLASKIERINFWAALQGVLTGMSLSFISTSYTGNYFGRVWHLKEKRRYQILGGMVVNSLSQAAVTYYFGGLGFIYLLYWKGLGIDLLPLWLALALFMLIGAICIFAVFSATGIVNRLKRWAWLYEYLQVIATYGLRDSAKLIALSALRYSTFTTQFVICLWLFDPQLPSLHAFSGVSIMYLAKAVIPNVSFLTDLGIRELTAIQLFGPNGFNASEGATMAATLALWAINLLLPVLVGSVFVFKMRVNSKSE